MSTHEELSGPVAVIAGGLSHERDVSLASGRNLVRELRQLGVEAEAYDFDRNLLTHPKWRETTKTEIRNRQQANSPYTLDRWQELYDAMPRRTAFQRSCRAAFALGLLEFSELPASGDGMPLLIAEVAF